MKYLFKLFAISFISLYMITANATIKHAKLKTYDAIGIASWYGYESGPRYKHRPKTASGEYFDPNKLTAAHRTLRFGTKLQVTNMLTHKSVNVIINDRGPFIHNRIIDLSRAAAQAIKMNGIQKVALHKLN
jgi:rare lipoprotein A